MTDEIALRKDVDRAARAKALLEDSLIAEAFAELDRAYVTAWRNSDPRDDDGRYKLWQAVQLLGKVQTHLQQVIASGTFADAELKAAGL